VTAKCNQTRCRYSEHKLLREIELIDNGIYSINLPDAVTLGGAYDGGGASPAGLQWVIDTFVYVDKTQNRTLRPNN